MDQALNQKVDRLLDKFDAALGLVGAPGVDPDRSMTTEEAAEFLRIHKTSLLRYAQAGSIPFHQLGKTYTFTRADLIAFRDAYRTDNSKMFRGKLITQGK